MKKSYRFYDLNHFSDIKHEIIYMCDVQFLFRMLRKRCTFYYLYPKRCNKDKIPFFNFLTVFCPRPTCTWTIHHRNTNKGNVNAYRGIENKNLTLNGGKDFQPAFVRPLLTFMFVPLETRQQVNIYHPVNSHGDKFN